MRFYLSVSLLFHRGSNGKGSIPRNKGAFPTYDPLASLIIINR